MSEDIGDDNTFGGKLPAMSERDKEDVKEWLARDKEFATKVPKHREKMAAKITRWAAMEESQTPWWVLRKGESIRRPTGAISIIYPTEKAQQRTKARKRREVRFTPQQLKSMADVEDHIVPVRLDLEHDHHRLSDTFMWNCSDTVVTPELFAQTICDDFKLPGGQFIPKIVAAIKERVREYQDQVLPIHARQPAGPTGRGIIDLDDAEGHSILEVFRRAHESDDEVKTDEGADQDDSHIRIVSFDDEVDDKIMTVDEAMACLPATAVTEDDELRILVKVDIIVGTQNLSDTFEWDLNSTVSPEEFAVSYCKDLGLSGEFVTAISHDIHEQIVTHQRSLFLVGHTPGSGSILNDDVRGAFLPPLTAALRKEDVAMSNFTPVLANFTEADVLAIEKERERESKRKKRATRGRRGVVLPDREPLKTFRTLLHSAIDASVVAAAEATIVPAPVINSTRRAAAIAAQANINLALQDLPLPAPPSPPVAPPTRNPRGRPPRFPRGGSRASPSSTREGSVINGDHSTPTAVGHKRGLREESENEAGSPLPPRKRHNGRIADSPDVEDVVKAEDGGPTLAPAAPTDSGRASVKAATPVPIKSWHCKNCGVPETLAGGRGKSLSGELELCAKCGEYCVA